MRNLTKFQETANVTFNPHVADDVVFWVVICSYVISLTTNILVIVVILRSEILRKSFAHIFIVGLCTFDSLASGSLGSKCIVLLGTQNGLWIDNPSLLNVDGFFNAFFALSTIYCIVAITFEKFYCIKYPMHYSTHMNRMIVCVTICVIVTLSALIASMPLGWNGYSKRMGTCRCMSLWGDDIRPFFVFFVGVVVFVIPVMSMMFVNCEVYKIAKKAMIQINPLCGSPSRGENMRRVSVINMEDTSGPQLSLGSERDFTVVKVTNCIYDSANDYTCDHANNAMFGSVQRTDRQLTESNDKDRVPESFKCSQNSCDNLTNSGSSSACQSDTSSKRSEPANFKALKSLLLPFSYFLLIWGSYFLLHIHWMLVSGIHRKALMETICVLIVHVSYALNPLVFGVKSRLFREELAIQLKKCCSRGGQQQSEIQAIARSQENFMQFLERTSQPNALKPTQ